MDTKNYGYLIAFLCTVYSSGQLGFCICFFGVNYDFLVFDIWFLVEGLVVFGVSIILGIGIYLNRKKLILAWIFTIIVTIVLYLIMSLYALITAPVIVHYEFIPPAMIWKVFLTFSVYSVWKYYREMGK